MWIEAKIIKGNYLIPRPRQFIELQRIYRPPHCIAFMIGWKADYMYIAPPDMKVALLSCLQSRPGEKMGDFIRRAIKEEEGIERS
jgi:hypothetical protein